MWVRNAMLEAHAQLDGYFRREPLARLASMYRARGNWSLCVGSYNRTSGAWSHWVGGRPAGSGTSAKTILDANSLIGCTRYTDGSYAELFAGTMAGWWCWPGRYFTDADARAFAADPFRMWRRRSLSVLVGTPTIVEQARFRWYNDDGDEDGSTAAACFTKPFI